MKISFQHNKQKGKIQPIVLDDVNKTPDQYVGELVLLAGWGLTSDSKTL